MYYLIYASQETEPMSNQMLLDLLDQANSRNKDLDITGLLIYIKGRFIQLLEGDVKHVYEVYSSIERDSRHHHVTLLLTGYHTERLFPDWSMAFKRSTAEEFNEVSGSQFLDDVQELKDLDKDSHPALIFIKHFNNQLLKHYETELSDS